MDDFCWFYFYLIEEGFALFAVTAHGVVLAIVADTARNAPGRLVNGRIEMAPVRMVVAVAPFAGVGLAADGRPPR